jgi:hypothetical protein
MIIPEKETIYSHFFPGTPTPAFLQAFHSALRERDVTVVEIESAFRDAMERGASPYFSDDSHWNATGVGIAAAALASWVSRDREIENGQGGKAEEPSTLDRLP